MAISPEVLSWLVGFAGMGQRFIEMYFKLDRATGKVIKKPRRTLAHYERMTGENGLSFALACLENGSPIGIQPTGRLYVIDADNAAQVNRLVDRLFDLGITPLMVSTRRGAHFYFLLPVDFPMDGLKQALHLPNLDFIFGPVSLVVAPGSKSKGRDYIPKTAFFPPPVLNPRDIEPDGLFWDEIDNRPFLVSKESPARRRYGARGYLTHQAPVCVRGIGRGTKTLGRVAAQVVGYWGMAPTVATEMMRGPESWNARFVDANGKPAPFSRDEIYAACQAAQGKGSPYGRIRWIEEQTQLENTAQLEGNIEILKTCLTMPAAQMVPTAYVYPILNPGGLSETVIGKHLGAHGIKRPIWGESRTMHIAGVAPAMVDAVLSAKFEAKIAKRGSVCPLIPMLSLAPGFQTTRDPSPGGSPKEPQVSHVSGQDSGERLDLAASSPETIDTTESTFKTSEIIGYQTTFEWAEVTKLETLSPASTYLDKLGTLARNGMLSVMSAGGDPAIRDQVVSMFWPGQKAGKDSLRMMRHAVRHAGLVGDGGALTPAGLLALGMGCAA